MSPREQQSFQWLRNHLNDRQSKQQHDQANLQQFVIINDRQLQQILQINLLPAHLIYHQGEIIYSNSYKTNKIKNRNNKILALLGFSKKMNIIINDTPALLIAGIKHQKKNGQIIILDLSVYRQCFYINSEYVLASRKEQLNRKTNPVINKLQINIFEALSINQEYVALQANSMIMEKYLDKDQEFCVYKKENIIACSTSTALTLYKDGIVKVTGPGWLFYQTPCSITQTKRSFQLNCQTILFLCLLLVVIEIGLAAVF